METGDDTQANVRRSAASELLDCIAATVLERGTLDLLFAGTPDRLDLALTSEETRDAVCVVAAGAAELNLLPFLTADKQLDLRALRHAVGLLVAALEMGVDGQIYGDEGCAVLAHNERRLAIGAANLEQLLNAAGVALDSDDAEAIAACVAGVLGGEGMWQSARIAETCPAIRTAIPRDRSRRADDALEQDASSVEDGACPAFRAHPERLLGSLRAQRAKAHRMVAPERERSETTGVILIRSEAAGAEAAWAERGQQPLPALVRQLPELIACAREVWDGALMEAERFGLRHCGVFGQARGARGDGRADSGDGDVAVSNQAIETAATQIRMLAASQPFVDVPQPCSIDLPPHTTAADLAEIVRMAWASGLPGISLLQWERRAHASDRTNKDLRDMETMQLEPGVEAASDNMYAHAQERADTDTASSAETQGRQGAAAFPAPRVETAAAGAAFEGMTLAEAERVAMARGHATLVETQLHRISELEEQLKVIQARARENGETHDAQEPPRSMRHRLPAERASVTHKFVIAGHEGYITVGLYPNGSPGEIFLRMTKEGSAVAGLMDSFATAVSLALQHGVPVRVLAEQFAETRFEPSGVTANDQIPYALSIMDYLFRWIELRFLSGHQMDLFANLSPSSETVNAVRVTGTISGPKSSVVPNLPGTRGGTGS